MRVDLVYDIDPTGPVHPRVREFVEWLRHVHYKPGVRAEVRFDRYQMRMTMTLIAKVPDARRVFDITSAQPGHPLIEVVMPSSIPVYMLCVYGRDHGDEERLDTDRCTHFVKHAIIDLEHHEIDEWLRVGNKWVQDPHPPRLVGAPT